MQWEEEEAKTKDLANVRLSVRLSTKLIYTKTHERIKLIKFIFQDFFLMKDVYLE